METGKIVSQCGHAYIGAYLQCKDSDIISEYHKEFPHSPGTKICLKVNSLDDLLKAESLAHEAGIPYFRVVDSGCSNFYGGTPTITALGIGPVSKSKIQHITKKYKLL